MIAIIPQILIGAAALLLGRQIFWIFVGAVGFFVGLAFASIWFDQFPAWISLLASLGLGLLFALLAVFLQKPMAALAGFFAIGLLILGLFRLFAGNVAALDQFGWVAWLVFVVGGIVGAVFVFVTFDWALIILSSISGANMIIGALDRISSMPAVIALILFVLMVVTGIWVQSRMLVRARPAPQPV